METGVTLLPDGYRFYKREECEMMGNGKEEFNVKNRSFLNIDGYFSQGISHRINESLDKRPGEQIRVLALAGGTESQAVKDIEKKFGNHVKALNIDIAQNIEKGEGAGRVQGDATYIPLADSSVDIVYSRQFLPFVRRFNPEHNIQIKKILSEVARVLKPGGTAFLDDEEELSGIKSDRKRQELVNEFGVILESHDSARPVGGDRNFPKFWSRSIRPEKFLVMKKP